MGRNGEVRYERKKQNQTGTKTVAMTFATGKFSSYAIVYQDTALVFFYYGVVFR